MIGPVEAAFRTALADAVTDWPIRWPNGQWEQMPDGCSVGEGNMPVTEDADGVFVPAPAIEVEVIGGPNEMRTVGIVGSRAAVQSGILRLYLSVAQGSGTTDITAKADAINAAFQRKEFGRDEAAGQRIVTFDPRTDDGVAAYEEGNRFSRMISVPFDFYYQT